MSLLTDNDTSNKLSIPQSAFLSPDDNQSNITLLTEYSKKQQPAHRLMIFVTFSAWMTFASLLLFQANLLDHIEHNWRNNKIPTSQKIIFQHGISFTFIGTIIFRLGHEIFWSSYSCHTRVILSLCCMIFSMVLLLFIFFILSIKYCWWIILCNLIGGIGIGAIEPNLLTS
eukprot:80361_1